MGFQELSGWQTRAHVEGGARQLQGTETSALGTFPDLALDISSSGCLSVSFTMSCNKLVNFNASLSPVIHSCKLIDLKRGLWEPPICSQVRSCGNLGTCYLLLASEVGAVLWAEPLPWGIGSCLQADGVRMELNGRAPGGCPQWFGVGNSLPGQ